jgi:hypothetical protein
MIGLTPSKDPISGVQMLLKDLTLYTYQPYLLLQLHLVLPREAPMSYACVAASTQIIWAATPPRASVREKAIS